MTSDGIAYSYKGNKKQLKGPIKKSGYIQILINHKGVRDYILLHRLIAETFIQNPLKKRTVNHKDGNKLNNKVSNLEWMTDSENLIHARDNGLLKTCKIDMVIANKIRADSGTNRGLAKKYKISKTQIGYIKNNKRWF